MTYTQSRPPVIKLNLGRLTVAPICTVVNTAGITVSTGAMTRITNTTIWYYAVPGNTLSATYAEYAYYVSDSNSNVLNEGTFSIEDSSTGLSGAITTKDFDCPSVVGTPAAISATKTYTIRFRPGAADGTFISGVTGIGVGTGPGIAIVYKNSINATTFNRTASMSLANNIWEYDWVVDYTTPADLVKVTITCEHSGKQYTFVRNLEILKPKEFNPQRISVGSVG